MGERLQFDESTSKGVIKEISNKISAVAPVIESKNLEQTRKAIEPIIVDLSDNVESFLALVSTKFQEGSKERNQAVQFQSNLIAGRREARNGNTKLLISSLLTILALYLPTEISAEFKEKENLELFLAALGALEQQDAAVAVFKKRFEDLRIEVTKHEYSQNNTVEGATDRSEKAPVAKERKAHKALKAMFTAKEATGRTVDMDGTESTLKTVETADEALGRVDLDGIARVLAARPLPKNDAGTIAAFWNSNEVAQLYSGKQNATVSVYGKRELVALQQLTQMQTVVADKRERNAKRKAGADAIALTPAEEYVQAVLGTASAAGENRAYRTAVADQLRLQQITEVHDAAPGNLVEMFEVILNNDLDAAIEAPSKDTDLSSLRAIRRYQNNKKNPVGTGTLMEGQKVDMFAVIRQQMIDTEKLSAADADKRIVQNFAAVLLMDTGISAGEKAMLAKVDSPEALYTYFLTYPAGLTRLRKRIGREGEFLASMIEHGPTYLQAEARRIEQATQGKTEGAEQLLQETLPDFDNLDPALKQKLIEAVGESTLETRNVIGERIKILDQQLASPDLDKKDRKRLEKQRAELVKLKETLSGEEYITSVARTTWALGVAHVDELTSVGVGVSREVKFTKGRLAKNLVDNITFSGGVLQGLFGPDGKVVDGSVIGTNLAVGVSFGKTWEVGKRKARTLFYTVGAGAGLNFQTMTVGLTPYALTGTSYTMNGVTYFGALNAAPGVVGATVGAKIDVLERFRIKFEQVKLALTSEVQAVIKEAKGDFSYENILKILRTKFEEDITAKKHMKAYATLLSDILGGIAKDPVLGKDLASETGQAMVAALVSGAFLEKYNTDMEKINTVQLTGGAVGVQCVYTPWFVAALPTAAVFLSIIKKGAYTPDKESMTRQAGYKEKLAGATDTQYTFENVEEVNILMRIQDRSDDGKGEVTDVLPDAKLEVRGENKEYIFIPYEFFSTYNLEIAGTVPYITLPSTSSEIAAAFPEKLDKAGILVPSKAKPVVVRHFFGNHREITLAVVSQESDARERVLPTTTSASPSTLADFATYSEGLERVETYVNAGGYIKQLKSGLERYNTEGANKGGRALFDTTKDPILEMSATPSTTPHILKLPLAVDHGMDLSKIDAKYSTVVRIENIGGTEYLVLPSNLSIQFVQAKDQTARKGPKKTYALVKGEVPLKSMPRLEMSVHMEETFSDKIELGMSEIISAEPDQSLVDFLSTSDAASMLIRRRSELIGGKNMHTAYYDAIKSKDYAAAAKIATDYITEAIAKASPTERQALQTMRDNMTFDHNNPERAISSRSKANLQYIYASLSRVMQTEKKHLTSERAQVELTELIANLDTGKYAPRTLALLQSIGSKIITTEGAFDGTMQDETGKDVLVRAWLEKTLRINYEKQGGQGHVTGGGNAPLVISPEYRIAYLLVNMEQIAKVRTTGYERRMNNEDAYRNNPAALRELMAIRKKSMDLIPNKPLANGDAEQLENTIGLVAGYGGTGAAATMEEKFVYHPRVLKASMVVIDAKTYPNHKAHKQYYLENLRHNNPEALESIAEQLVTELRKHDVDTSRLVDAGGNYNYENLFDMLINEGKVKGKLIPGIESVSAQFVFSFFPECINEMLILNNLKIKYKKVIPYSVQVNNENPVIVEIEHERVSRKLAVVNYTVANRSVREQKDLPTIGVVVGRIPQPKPIEGESSTTVGFSGEPSDLSGVSTDQTYNNDYAFTTPDGQQLSGRPGFTDNISGISYAKDMNGNRYQLTANGGSNAVSDLLISRPAHVKAATGQATQMLENTHKREDATYIQDDPNRRAIDIQAPDAPIIEEGQQ